MDQIARPASATQDADIDALTELALDLRWSWHHGADELWALLAPGTQGGNNNAYCHDDARSWIDWTLDDRAQRLLSFTRHVIALRHEHAEFRRRRFFQGQALCAAGMKDIAWLRPDGAEMTAGNWQLLRACG